MTDIGLLVVILMFVGGFFLMFSFIELNGYPFTMTGRAWMRRKRRRDCRIGELMDRGHDLYDAQRLADAELTKEAQKATEELRKVGVE